MPLSPCTVAQGLAQRRPAAHLVTLYALPAQRLGLACQTGQHPGSQGHWQARAAPLPTAHCRSPCRGWAATSSQRTARHRIYSRAVTWSGVMSILGSHAGLQGPPVLFLYFPEEVNTPAALWTPRTFKTRRRGAPTTGGAGLGPGRGTLTPSTHRNGAPRLVTGPQNSDFFMPPEL